MFYASIYNTRILSQLSIDPMGMLKNTQTYRDYITNVLVSARRMVFVIAATGLPKGEFGGVGGSQTQPKKGMCKPF